ncbi:MAG: hypothetical protein JRH11_10395 [Deltaproteobacteria bacterium]|nr:hypothetical protein [Deltaproteobacteria bacterium]
MGLWAFSLAATFIALVPATASGQAAPPVEAGTLLAEAERAEQVFDLGRALGHYEDAARAGAGTRAGRRAEERAEYLRERRSENGTFDDLARLERMRRGEADEARLRAFARAVDVMESGPVRAESLFFLGEAYFRRLHDPAAAVPFYGALVSSPAATPSRRRTATVALAEAHAASGAPAAALAELEQAGLEDRFEAEVIRSDRGREIARVAATAVFVLCLGLLFFVGRPLRTLVPATRALRRVHVFAALYVFVVPATIAGLYDPAVIWGFLLNALGALPLLFVANACAHSLRRRRASGSAFFAIFVAVLAALGAVAWLALDAVDGLASFGFP